jgi:O-antigen/teichoic acid export membrane protein
MKKEAIVGAVWTLIDRIGGQALSLISFVILARLLLPDDYGVVSLAAAIVVVPGVLLNEGFGTALIQRQELDDDHINVAFWVNIFLSLFFVATFMATANWAAETIHNPSLTPILRLMSLTLIPVGIASIAGALFRRRLQYSAFALRTLIAQVTSAVIAIVMALLGFGVWALVAQQLGYAAVNMTVLWIGVGWKPRLSFSVRAFRDIFHFATRAMLGNSLRFAHERADALIIGLFLSPAALGFYYLTQRLLVTVYSVTILPVGSVMMPVLSRMQGDRERFRSASIRMLCMTASLWVPAVVGLGVTAPRMIALLFGEKWQPAATLMMVMSGTAFTRCFTCATREILLSVNRAGIYAALNSAQLILTIVLFLVGVQYGIIGCGAAYVAVSLLVAPFHLYAVMRYADVPPREVISRLLPVLGAGAIMALVVYGAGELLAWSNWAVVSQIGLGMLVYPLALYSLGPDLANEVLNTVHQTIPGRFRR